MDVVSVTSDKPRLAITAGDPSGIGPELVAKLLESPETLESADIVLVGDRHLFERGAAQAGLAFTAPSIGAADVASLTGIAHLECATISEEEVAIAEVTEAGGRTSLRCLDRALDLAQQEFVDGVLFAPFNKAAMTKAGLDVEDEHVYMARYIGFEGHRSEINVLGDLMTTRVTSHIALKDVAAHIDEDGVIKAAKLAHDTLRRSGKTRPRIAIAALNPHAGDHGKFGREEIDILEPAVRRIQERQIDAIGPLPSDTVFLKAKAGEVDAVVTMYHDQGQIAIKLMGFDRGVTVAGGLPIPVATPAHGTAFDIAGRNQADVGATLEAFRLLVRMGTAHRASRAASTE